MCAFCVVPFTRGRERSRDPQSIIRECEELLELGYREIILLGQNVDSYYWTPTEDKNNGWGQPITFSALLEMVALINPSLRIRFSTSHPKDITDDVLHIIAKYENICNCIHLPVQSGSNRILQLMNRSYTREWYMAKVDRIREIIPGCGISSDIIAGFCTETEEDHQQTIGLINDCNFDFSYMYFYSERPGTLAAKRYEDDVPEAVKKKRLDEIVKLQRRLSEKSNQADVGKTFKVLIEGNSKKSENEWMGRSSGNKVLVFFKDGITVKGDYVQVLVTGSTGGTLLGQITR
jgi:tRNA-2-methylthio-N6-dimethylallyladenosine synthase